METDALEHEALAHLDQSPCEALELARIAHDHAHTDRDPRAQPQTSLTLAIVLNRMGEFRGALMLSRSAAIELEKQHETRHAARCYCEAAWAETFLGHLEDAVADSERARQLDSSDLMQARCDWIQARVRRDQGDYPGAETLLENSRVVFEAVDMPLDAARCTRELGHTYLRSERSETLHILELARQTFESFQCSLDVALCDFLIAVDLIEKSQYADAQKWISQAYNSFTQVGAEFFVAWSEAHLGIINWYLNRFEDSVRALRRARDYFLSRDVPAEVSTCDINLGNTFYSLNRYDEALEYYQEAATLSQAEGRDVRAARIYENMALVFARQGHFSRSLDLYQRALQTYEAKRLPVRMANCHVNSAATYLQLGQHDEAIDRLHYAREIFAQNQRSIDLAECLLHIADAHFARGELERASIHLNQARRIYTENELESFAAACDRQLARVLGQSGERERALSLAAQSRSVFTKHTQIVDAALCDLAEGEIHVEWGEYTAARDAFGRARAILSPGFPDQAWRADYGLARCTWQAGDRAAALKLYLDSVHTIADSRSRLVTEQLSNDFFASRQPVYDDALAAALELGAAQSALETIEASKARGFLSLLRNRDWKFHKASSDPYVTDLITRERDLRYQLDTLRARAAVQAPTIVGEVLRGEIRVAMSVAVLQELDALSQAYEAVVTQLRLASVGLVGTSSPPPFALDRFRQSMNASFGTDWAALDYYLSSDRLTIAVVRPSGLDVEQRKLTGYDLAILDKCVTKEPDLRELIYRGTLRGESAPSPGVSYLSHLARLLIPEEPATTLIISPHGSLHALPFHALMDGDGYLVERHTLVYAPSFQVLDLLLTDSPKGLPVQSLVVGLSDFGQQMYALPFAADEVESVRGVFKGHAQVWWGDQASLKKLLDLNTSGELRKFDLIHFATHAILDGAAPHHSRVLLSDAALTLFDILDLELDARLVTLSACQTALGKGGRGDELIGLVRAFFYAGAQALLATLWNVEDRSMVELTGRFYRHLAGGENNATALRSAQLDMIHAGYSPYQWAPLLLIGHP